MQQLIPDIILGSDDTLLTRAGDTQMILSLGPSGRDMGQVTS